MLCARRQLAKTSNRSLFRLVRDSIQQTRCFECLAIFGGEKRAEPYIVRAEALLKKWRAWYRPTRVCGDRGYYLVGKAHIAPYIPTSGSQLKRFSRIRIRDTDCTC